MRSPEQIETTLARPRQAVILAGGKGTRLRPLTDTRPKPMIDFHGKPFLEYLVEQLRDQGFERILLLLGYLPEVIRDYFGHGRRWGVSIEYAVSAVEDETGRRLKLALPRLDPCFLLMYCDNYWPLQTDKMWRHFAAADVPAMLTVYTNKDNYSKDGVAIDSNGYVTAYDKTRSRSGLKGVEIGYAFIKKSVVESLPDDNVLFESIVYPKLALQQQLLAYLTDHRYYSVGSLERLPLTHDFLARRPAILLDRDGVLNKKPPRAHYVRRWEEFTWLPGVKHALRLLREAHYRVIVISNQAGIGRRAMTETDLQRIHERMQAEVADGGGRIDGLYYCPHDWDAGCECRKPRPGMLFQAQRDFGLDLSRTLFVGDDERDAEAAERAGCASALLSEHVSLLDITRDLVGGMPSGESVCEPSPAMRGETVHAPPILEQQEGQP